MRGRFSSLRHAAALLVAITAAPAAAGEKSGVEPTAVSLPGGPGSIEGLGESFEPALATGTAKHRVGIALPPGVAGHTPNLSLSYDGGFANGPLGYGWECGPGTVKRQCERGVPRYREPGEDDTFLGADGVELVELENGSFLSRLEGGFTRYRRVWADRAGHPELFHWEAHSRDGARHEFGRTEAARVSLPAAESPSGRARIHSWLLERVTDVHGNAIEYRHGDLGRPVDRQKYLLEVRYGPGAAPWAAFHFARLEYEDRPDWFSDCRAGFAVRTGKRLRAIHIGIQGALPADTPGCARGDWNGDGVEDALIRRYELLYEGHRHWSLLSQVTLVGSDGVSSLPPAAFRYGALDADLATERTLAVGEGHLFASQGEPLEVLDSERVDLLDLNSDGLPDLLQTTDGVHHAYYNLGLKEGGAGHGARLQWSPRSDPVVPEGAPLPEALGFGLGMENVHLADMDADGVSDLVVTEGEGVTPGVRYFKNLGGGAFWGKAVRMSIAGTAPPPPYESTGDDIRTADLNFDKHIDVVASTPAGYTVWYNQGGGAYAAAERIPGAVAGAPGQEEVLLFSDPTVRLADLNGDRLVDAARIEARQVVYARSLGWGSFAGAVAIALPGGATLSGDQLARAELRDLNGDGLADLVVERAEGRDLWFWTNLGTEAFSARRVVQGLPALPDGTRTAWTDMDGSGTVDLVTANSALPDGFRIQVVDIGLLADGSANPRLLEKIDNGLGLRTEISYRSSAAEACTAREHGNPWKLSNPNPVTVVARVETSTGLDLDGIPGPDVSRVDFSYRDGYYDPTRRQFAGFGFVKRLVHGDERAGGESAKTLVERHAFHTGGPDGIDNDGDGLTDETDDWMGREEEPLKGCCLWSEKASLPDDPSRDGGYADDAHVFERTVSPLATWEVRRIATARGGPLPALLGDGYRTKDAAREVLLVVSRETNRYLIEEGRGPVKRVCTTGDDNALGDTLFRWEFGEYGEGAPASDDRYTEHEYAHNQAAWILGLPARVRVRAGGPGGAFVSESRSHYDGAAFVGLPLGEAGARGLLHRVQSFVSEPADWTPPGPALPDLGELSLAIGDPRQPGAAADTSRSRFDAFGNRVAALDANGNRRELAYDATLRTHAISETIFTGQPGGPLTVNARYHLGHGTVLESRDLNGHLTAYAFDTFGRLVAVVRPGDSTEHPTMLHRYAAANPQPLAGTRPRPGAAPLPASLPVHYEYDASGAPTLTQGEGAPRVSSVRSSRRETAGGGTFDQLVFADGAGRRLAALEESGAPGRWVVTGAAWYNLRGLARRGFQPYEQEGDRYRTPEKDTALHADLYQDAAGRNVRTVAPPDAEGVRHEARTVHRPLEVESWDEEDTRAGGPHSGTYRSTFSDGLGRTVRVVERNRRETDPGDDATEYVTTYAWTLHDRLAIVRDAQDNTKYLRHDGLGRKIFQNDPDSGRRVYTYDPAGNLVDFVDAGGQRTVQRYDGANRLLARNFLDQSGDPATDPEDEVFVHDVATPDVDLGDGTRGAARNPRGELTSVRDLSGELHSSHDERGRVEWLVKVVADPPTGVAVAYRTAFAYDSLDRLTDLFYPDNDHAAYAYNPRTFLESVRGGPGGAVILAGRSYTPSGQVESTEFGNGVGCQYAYDPRLRLTGMIARGAALTAGEDLLHYAYRFDGASNILAIADRRPGLAAGDPRHNSQRFEYDDLYRLTRYQRSDAGLDPGANHGELRYRYDRLGNILEATSPATGAGHLEHDGPDGRSLVNLGSYQYAGGRSGRPGRGPGDPPGPRAVTATASGRSYRYDAGGNALEINGLGAVWDFADRLTALRGPGFEARYLYDHAGERVVKTVTRGGRREWVIYVNEHFEVREGDAPTKYVHAGGARIAQVKGTLDPARPRLQRLRLVAGWNLVTPAVEITQPTARRVFGLEEHGAEGGVTAVLIFDGRGFTAVAPDDAVAVGGSYWVHAARPQVRPLLGSYRSSPPLEPVALVEGLNVIAWPRLEGLVGAEAFAGIRELWFHDGPSSGWLFQNFGAPGAADNLPRSLPPGAGLWAFAPAGSGARFVPAATAAQDILFYHADHLGSANAVTDREGRLVEETAFYPFGAVRHQHRGTSWFEMAYKHTGKERDAESGLSYFGARYYDPVVGRFASVDPLLGEDAGDRENPQRLGLYTYVRNNPIALVDPTGLIEMDPFKLAIKAKKAFWGVKEPKPAPSKNTGKYLKGDQWQSSKALNPTTDDVPGLAFGLIPAGQFGKYKEAVQSYRNLKRFNDVADAGDRGNDIDAGFATAGAFPFLGQGIGLGRIILALADRSGLLKDGGYTSNPTDPSMDAAKVGALKGEAHYRAVGKRETAWAGLLYDPDPNATLGELIEREERRRQPPTLGRNKPRARKSPADIGLEGIGEPGTIGE